MWCVCWSREVCGVYWSREVCGVCWSREVCGVCVGGCVVCVLE